MRLFIVFMFVFFVLVASCSSKSPVLPVQGGMIGRSERFCIALSERVEVDSGYICGQIQSSCLKWKIIMYLLKIMLSLR